MLNVLKSSINFAERLARKTRNLNLKENAQVIVFSIKLVQYLLNDLIDQRFLQSGLFKPFYVNGYVNDAV